MYVCMWACTGHVVHMQVRRQLARCVLSYHLSLGDGTQNLDRLGSKCSNLLSHLTSWIYLLKVTFNLYSSHTWKTNQFRDYSNPGKAYRLLKEMPQVSALYTSQSNTEYKDEAEGQSDNGSTQENVIPRWRDHTRLWGRDGMWVWITLADFTLLRYH